jgi:threonyl-tRNA synthetase
MAFFMPKGQAIYATLTDYIRKQNRKRNYKEVQTPFIMDESLWHRSGHWDNYKENMYFTEVDGRVNAVKPMNCPGHVLLYESGHYSYRDLPLRMAEFGRCHRYERSGVTHGLFRVRAFVQDDAHVFCTPDQIEEEVMSIIRYVQDVYKDFGFHSWKVALSTRPEKSIGADEMWRKAETALAHALKRADLKYDLNPGDGAFYGPKIDFSVEDSIGRWWQCGTCQLDFSMPGRFEIKYIGEDGAAHTPVMIHKAIVGSFERFFGILVEHYSGAFPFWLAPTQLRIINITDAQRAYAEKLKEFLENRGFRVEADLENEKLGAKIRRGQLDKIPYMLVVGDKEVETQTVTVRPRAGEQMASQTWDQIAAYLQTHEDNPMNRIQ